MLQRAVEGLRGLDPTRAEQYIHPSDYSVLPIASGAVGEAPPETVFVQYYEDGRADNNPTKKKVSLNSDSRVCQLRARGRH